MSSLRSPKKDMEMFRDMLLSRRAEEVRRTRREDEADWQLRKEREAIQRELDEVDSKLRRHAPGAQMQRVRQEPELSPRSRAEREHYEKKRELMS